MSKRKSESKSRQSRRSGRDFGDEERRAAVADVGVMGLATAALEHGLPKSTLHAWTKSPRWKEPAFKEAKRSRTRSRRFTPEQREHALEMMASGMKRTEIASAIGTTTESLRRWRNEAEEKGTMPPPLSSAQKGEAARVSSSGEQAGEESVLAEAMVTRSPYAPRDPGHGLSELETSAILSLKKKHPSMGPAQIRAQLKRFKGWRVSVKAIARVLRANGYQLVHRGSRPEGPEPVRFEAPHRNALWQMDYADFRIAGEKLHLCVALDDFSRYAVGHVISDAPSSEAAIEVIQTAIARHGKPEVLRTDRGGAFQAAEFTGMLEAELIDHIVGRSYHPQGGGKVESLIGTVRRELWDTEHFADREEAERRVTEFLEEYNERRAHMGIDGLTPADRYFGRGDRVLATIDALSRNRQGALAQVERSGVFEELAGKATAAPMEVLRLVIVDGAMELRFCGARVRLGPIER